MTLSPTCVCYSPQDIKGFKERMALVPLRFVDAEALMGLARSSEAVFVLSANVSELVESAIFLPCLVDLTVIPADAGALDTPRARAVATGIFQSMPPPLLSATRDK